MCRSLTIILFFLCKVTIAAPNAGMYADIDGVRVFQDHEKAWVWYPTPADPKLDTKEGPGYALDLFRYLGRSGTGDKDQYWTRGILSLKLERSRDPGQLKEIKKQLREKTGGRLLIKSLPVVDSQIQINFADVDNTWQQSGRWQGGVLQVVLDTTQSQLLWEADSTLLSLTVTETSIAKRLKDKEWVSATSSSSWTVEVPMSQDHADAYRKNDLTAQLSMAYNEIEVFCFDFLEQLQEDLYVKEVEVGFPAGDRPLIERVRFDASSDYRQHLRFPLAKTQDEPLRYRIIETFVDGRRQVGEWQRKRDEFLLDITAYRPAPDESDEDNSDEPPDSETSE